jgi:hypothetical protein
VEGRDKRFIKSAFGKYVSPAVVDAIAENPAALKKLTMEYDGNASSSGASVTLSVYNWRTGAWSTIDGPRFATTVDRRFSWSTTTPLDFVSTAGQVRFRIRTTEGSSRWFVSRTDLVRFTVTY